MINRHLKLIALVTSFFGNQSIAYSDVIENINAGKKIYSRCIGCHTPAYHRTDPKHCGLPGRHAGSVPNLNLLPQ